MNKQEMLKISCGGVIAAKTILEATCLGLDRNKLAVPGASENEVKEAIELLWFLRCTITEQLELYQKAKGN